MLEYGSMESPSLHKDFFFLSVWRKNRALKLKEDESEEEKYGKS